MAETTRDSGYPTPEAATPAAPGELADLTAEERGELGRLPDSIPAIGYLEMILGHHWEDLPVALSRLRRLLPRLLAQLERQETREKRLAEEIGRLRAAHRRMMKTLDLHAPCMWGGEVRRSNHEWYLRPDGSAICRQCGIEA